MNQNHNKQFLKIPKNWENISWEKRNIYIAYLWVKNYSRFGRVHISKIPKKHFGHYITKLISAGLMKREGEFYVLLSYESVWGLLGIKKVNVFGKQVYRWRKLADNIPSWREFKVKTIFDIQAFQTERKKAQIKKKVYIGNSPEGVNITPLFSSKASCKLFGYKSRTSGSKYREKFFDVVSEPLRLRLKYTSDKLPYFQFDCKRIELRTIFH